MKSIKQSRLDRLERREARLERLADKENRLTERQKIARDNRLFKKIRKQMLLAGRKKCPHGIPISGYWCLECRPDAIADQLREEWSPTPSYKILVYLLDDGDEFAMRLNLKTRNLTKKFKEMQQNGFWYPYNGKPIFMMPEKIKVIVLDEVEGYMPQNPSNSDPKTKPGSKEFGISVLSQR